MTDIYKINTNNTIKYNEINIKTSGSGNAIRHPRGFINIANIQNKYDNKFKGQPPGTGA